MLSHAQNFEDVMLYRALRHITNGCYVDVGAWHPQLHSVTKWFYDLGWSGINIEPSKTYYRMLKSRRPRDINPNIAIGSARTEMPFYEIPSSGLSSLSKNSVAIGGMLGFKKINSYPIQVLPLSQVIEKFIDERDIHFLKIDVEGLEEEVLIGADLTRNRPWIIVVEAVKPGSEEASWSGWEYRLLNAGYDFVWFDGVNRFYLRNESLDLKVHFQVPVNIFDHYQIPIIRNFISSVELRCQRFLL